MACGLCRAGARRSAALRAGTPPPTGPAELDPSAPLDPMPDLGVEWPDLNQPEPAAPPEVEGVAPEAAAEATEEAAEQVEDASATRALSLDDQRARGLDGGAERSARASTSGRRSKADRKKTANAAQIDRRARADAELLTELLRSQGYYDARSSRGSSAGGEASWPSS